MDTPEKTATENTEGLRLPEKIASDFVQSFDCNHVVVDISSKPDKKGSFYCVMCGEVVTSSGSVDQDAVKTVGDLKLGNSAKKGTLQTQTSIDSSRIDKRQGSANSRKTSSSSMSSSTSSVTSNRTCSIHSSKNIKYFCEDHQEIGCSVCVNVLHLGCERIMLIKDEIQTSDWSDKISQDTITALNAISKSFKDILDHTASSRQKLNAQILEFRKSRDELRVRLVRILDEFERKSEKKIKQYMSTFEQEMNANEENCKSMIKEAELSCGAIEEALSSKSTNDSFIVTHKVIQQRERFGKALSNAIKNSQDISIDLIPEMDIDSIEELKRVGRIKFSTNSNIFPESVISSVAKLPKSDLRSPRTARDARSESSSSLNTQMSFVGKYNVRLSEDKNTCENVGATFLHDGRVAIVDMSNRKLKVFDSKFSQPCSLTLSSDPRGITSVSPQEVAISLPDESKIQLVSTAKKLQTTRSILTALPCYGITCHNQNIFVLCNDGFKRTAIQILDFDGKILKMLQMNPSGKALLTNPWNIMLSVDGQQICVTDKGRLVNFDMDGKIIFEYIDKELVNARGLTVDDSGRFYVCGTGSNNVHRVSADGTKKRVVLTDDDVCAPQAVCYQLGKRLLLLTCVGNEFVFIYKGAKS